MIKLNLVGIGTGNPEHLTLQAIRALNGADVILIPRKGSEKSSLAKLRRTICSDIITNPSTRLIEFDLPQRDQDNGSYTCGVDDWHDAIASIWAEAIREHLPSGGSVSFMVWGDPSLFDSTMRIADRLDPVPLVQVIPGITSIQALTASHVMPLNEIGAPFLVTTGRRLRNSGWPSCADTLIIMLDGDCAFQHLNSTGVTIWWGAYVGMPEEIILSGSLADTGPRIISARAEARARHGWLMDIYILKRTPHTE